MSNPKLESDVNQLVDARLKELGLAGGGKEEEAVQSLVDRRISDALGISPKELDKLPDLESGVMATPSVLSTVRATAYVHC